jgi:predicted secreted hydrolase
VPVTCDPASDTVFKLGTTTVTCTAKDSSGNVSTGTFKVTVQDTKPPTLKIPTDITVEGNTKGGATVPFDVSASDGVDGTVPVICSAKSGDLFKVGATTVTCTAKDKAGNTASGSFKVTVQDTKPPVLTLPADMTVMPSAGANFQSAPVAYTATATDVVDGQVPVTCTPASGAAFKVGTTTVNCSAKDAAGNTATGSFRVTVRDVTPPVLHLPPNGVGVPNGSPTAVTYTVTATDNLDGNVPVSCSPPSGSTFAAGNTTVTCTATDSSGNKATGTFNVANFQPIQVTDRWQDI